MENLVPSSLLVRTLAAIGAVLLAGCALAGANARAQGPTLMVNEVAVVTFKASGGGFSPERRAEIAAQAINSSSDYDVGLVKDRAASMVMMGDRKVLTVTKDDASAHGRTIDALASSIVAKLKQAVGTIAFSLRQHRVWMPVDGTMVVDLAGPQADKVALSYLSGGPATAEQKGGKITITAKQAGDMSITVRYAAQEETLVVTVMPYAAVIGTPETAMVTGRPADKQAVAVAASRAVLAAIKAPLNAQITVEPLSTPELVPAQRGSATVRVNVRAIDCFPVEQDVTVDMKNIGMLENPSDELWYSNNPETIRGQGRLYWGRLGEGKAARVLYHHLNATPRPLDLRYMLVNTGDEPAQVALTLGDAAPHTNPTLAGYRAGQEFFPRWVRESASVVVVPPHSMLPVVFERFAPQQTASGLLALHSLAGNVLFIGDCSYGEGDPASTTNTAHAMQAVSLADASLNLVGQSEHVYSPAFKFLSTDYEVGGRFGYLRIGEHAVGRIDEFGKLSGNFGIVYKMEANLSNSTQTPTEVEVVFESSAGYTGGFFRINGVVYNTPLLQPKKTHQLLKLTLAPGERKTLFMETIPLSGGSYPVTVTIKPVGVG